MRQSFFASALCLSIVQTSVNARAHDKFSQLKIRNGQPVVEVAQNGGMFDWAHRLFRRHVQPRQSSGLCVEDSYYNIIQNLPNAQSFCQGYMNYPNETITVDYTPTRYVVGVDLASQSGVSLIISQHIHRCLHNRNVHGNRGDKNNSHRYRHGHPKSDSEV